MKFTFMTEEDQIVQNHGFVQSRRRKRSSLDSAIHRRRNANLLSFKRQKKGARRQREATILIQEQCKCTRCRENLKVQEEERVIFNPVSEPLLRQPIMIKSAQEPVQQPVQQSVQQQVFQISDDRVPVMKEGESEVDFLYRVCDQLEQMLKQGISRQDTTFQRIYEFGYALKEKCFPEHPDAHKRQNETDLDHYNRLKQVLSDMVYQGTVDSTANNRLRFARLSLICQELEARLK